MICNGLKTNVVTSICHTNGRGKYSMGVIMHIVTNQYLSGISLAFGISFLQIRKLLNRNEDMQSIVGQHAWRSGSSFLSLNQLGHPKLVLATKMLGC